MSSRFMGRLDRIEQQLCPSRVIVYSAPDNASEAEHERLLNIAAVEAGIGANDLLEPRARLLPEEKLEALLLAGDENAVARLLKEESVGIAEERRRYLMTAAVRRDRDLVDHLRDLYAGECQICGWAPRTQYGAEICEAHHVHWLSRGG